MSLDAIMHAQNILIVHLSSLMSTLTKIRHTVFNSTLFPASTLIPSQLRCVIPSHCGDRMGSLAYLPVLLEMLSHRHSLLDEMVEVLRKGGGQP